jgi:hypothetical protein
VAEIAKADNCDWFDIVDKNEMSRRDFAGFLGCVEKPRSAIEIKYFQKEPPTNAYSADDILQSITIKSLRVIFPEACFVPWVFDTP